MRLLCLLFIIAIASSIGFSGQVICFGEDGHIQEETIPCCPSLPEDNTLPLNASHQYSTCSYDDCVDFPVINFQVIVPIQKHLSSHQVFSFLFFVCSSIKPTATSPSYLLRDYLVTNISLMSLRRVVLRI